MINEKFVFTNSRGQSVEFGNRAPFIMLNHDGVGAVQANVQMQKAPFQDGMTYIDSLLETRSIAIQLVIMTNTQQELFERRSRLVSVLNPKLGPGVLKYHYGSGVREITATVEFAPVFPNGAENRGQTYQTAMVSLLCPDPAWRNPEKEHIVLASFTGGFSFPFAFPVDFGQVGQFLQIENEGDLDSPVFITFTGPLRNPVLENRTTGQSIAVIQNIEAGERLEINTAFGQKSVTIVQADGVRKNAFHYVSPDSEFWQLVPSINEVSYAATEEAQNAAVTVEFYHRYVGV